jgi:hypothetical protein
MNTHALGAVVIIASTWSVLGAGRDAAYFCTAEATGGIYFNKGSKRWEGTAFASNIKFVLRMKFIRDAEKETTVVSEYVATITKSGESYEAPCLPEEPIPGDFHVDVYNGRNYFTCRDNPVSYQFNLNTNRFLRFYEWGYVDGKDTNNDEPSATGGRCTRIE